MRRVASASAPPVAFHRKEKPFFACLLVLECSSEKAGEALVRTTGMEFGYWKGREGQDRTGWDGMRERRKGKERKKEKAFLQYSIGGNSYAILFWMCFGDGAKWQGAAAAAAKESRYVVLCSSAWLAKAGTGWAGLCPRLYSPSWLRVHAMYR